MYVSPFEPDSCRFIDRLVSRSGAVVRASTRELLTITIGVLLGKFVTHWMCVATLTVEVTMEILLHAMARLLLRAGKSPLTVGSPRLASGVFQLHRLLALPRVPSLGPTAAQCIGVTREDRVPFVAGCASLLRLHWRRSTIAGYYSGSSDNVVVFHWKSARIIRAISSSPTARAFCISSRSCSRSNRPWSQRSTPVSGRTTVTSSAEK